MSGHSSDEGAEKTVAYSASVKRRGGVEEAIKHRTPSIVGRLFCTLTRSSESLATVAIKFGLSTTKTHSYLPAVVCVYL